MITFTHQSGAVLQIPSPQEQESRRHLRALGWFLGDYATGEEGEVQGSYALHWLTQEQVIAFRGRVMERSQGAVSVRPVAQVMVLHAREHDFVVCVDHDLNVTLLKG